VHSADMTNLQPGNTYHYHVGSSRSTWSRVFQFTIHTDDDPVTFITYGDVGTPERQPHSVETLNCIRQNTELRKEIAFVSHVGDMAYAFEKPRRWAIWFRAVEDIAATNPYLISGGNRDDPEVIEERFHMPRAVSEVGKPSNMRNWYYSFDERYVHVAVISSNHNFSRGSPQYVWLKRDLSLARERVRSGHTKWIILMTHTPMYSSSDGHKGGNVLLKREVEPLLLEYGVDIAVYGDDHGYERSWPVYKDEPVIDVNHIFVSPQRPIHLVVGTGGMGLDGWRSHTPPAWSAYRELSHGYVTVRALGDTMKVRFVRVDNTVGDSFTIVKQSLHRSPDMFSSSSMMKVFLFAIALALCVWYCKGNQRLLGIGKKQGPSYYKVGPIHERVNTGSLYI